MRKLALLTAAVLLAQPGIAKGPAPALLGLQLESTVRGSHLPQTLVRVTGGEVGGIALFSEPSHTLFGVLLDNSAGSVEAAEASEWFTGSVAPFLGGPQMARVLAPLRSGASFSFAHGRRPATDAGVLVSMYGETLRGHAGSAVVTARIAVADPFAFGVQVLSDGGLRLQPAAPQ